MSPILEEFAQVTSLEELYQQLPHIGMMPGWNKPTPSMWAAPKKTFLPAHWNYAYAKGALDVAGRLLSTELAERRNLILENPLEGNSYATSRTLVAAYQMIAPGEKARSHRHTPNALRLIVEADAGTYTVVNGGKVQMSSGDVVLTPSWSWHGHGNESKSCAYWVDYLDIPLVQLLDPMFFEPHPEGFESDVAPAENSELIFPWKQTQQRLDQASPDPSGRYGTQVELGSPALATVALYMMRLKPGTSTSPFRTTASAIYSVVEGEGKTIVEGSTTLEWRRGDVFVVPSWWTHSHRTEKGAVLFRVTDEPALTKLGFLRCEAR
jgi:gentisate 1,2-dioxygenase